MKESIQELELLQQGNLRKIRSKEGELMDLISCLSARDLGKEVEERVFQLENSISYLQSLFQENECIKTEMETRMGQMEKERARWI